MYSVQNYNNQSRVFFQGHAKAVAVASHDKRIAWASILILLQGLLLEVNSICHEMISAVEHALFAHWQT